MNTVDMYDHACLRVSKHTQTESNPSPPPPKIHLQQAQSAGKNGHEKAGVGGMKKRRNEEDEKEVKRGGIQKKEGQT